MERGTEREKEIETVGLEPEVTFFHRRVRNHQLAVRGGTVWTQTQHVFIWRREAVFLSIPSIRLSIMVHMHTLCQHTRFTPMGTLPENILCPAKLQENSLECALTKRTMHTAASITQANLCREQEDGRALCFLCEHLFACYCELMSIYIFEFTYVALCLFMFVHTHASCVVVCSRNCVFVLVVGLEWNMDILPPSWIHRNGLGPGLQSTIYTNHSNLYHRLVIHVCLLCSALIQFHQEAPFLSPPPIPKTLSAEMFTPSPLRVSSAAPHRSWPSMQWFP